MALSLTSEAILFGINSALRLGNNIQRAYVNSIKARAIVLPLPAFNPNATLLSADSFFQNTSAEGGAQFIGRIESLQELHKKSLKGRLSAAEEAHYLDYYISLFRILRYDRKDEFVQEPSVNPEDIVGLLRIRQWEAGLMPEPSALQLVAGSLVETGIDLFQYMPGLVNPGSATGRALGALLDGFDKIRFSEAANFEQLISKEVVPALFIGGAEAIQELSYDIGQDQRLQAFIRATAEGIARDIIQRNSTGIDPLQKDENVQWGKLLTASMVRNAGLYLMHKPADSLGADEATSELIKATGEVLLSIILDESGEQLQLKKLLNTTSLDAIVRAALRVFSNYPELISKKDGLQKIVKELSESMAQNGIQRAGLLTETLELILNHTADNLYLFWDVEEDATEHLLVLASQSVMRSIANSNLEHWRFSIPQLTDLIHQGIDQVIKNPQWILKLVDGKPLLEDVLNSILKAMALIPKAQRLTFHSLKLLIETGLQAVAYSPVLAQKIRWADNETETTLLEQAYAIIVTAVFRKEEKGISQIEKIIALLEYVLQVILRKHPNKIGLLLAEIFVCELVQNTDQEAVVDIEVEDVLESTLLLLEERPELVSKNGPFQTFLKDLTAAIRPLIRVHPPIGRILTFRLIEQLGSHLQTLTKVEEDTLPQLLVETIQQFVDGLQLSERAEDEMPVDFGRDQLIELARYLLEGVLEHPEWVNNQLIRNVLKAVLDVIRHQRRKRKIPFHLAQLMLEESLNMAANEPALADHVSLSDGTSLITLTYALEWYIEILFQYPLEARRLLTEPRHFRTLIQHFLALVADHPITSDKIDQAGQRMNSLVAAIVKGDLSIQDFIVTA